MNNFDKNWRSAKKDIFRLEGRAEYRIPGEQASFADWKKGEFDMAKNDQWQKWIGLLKSTTGKGIVIKRVRVAPNPLPDYIKFEIDLWQKYSAKNGEEILFIGTNEYRAIIAEYGFNTKDFYLFDDEKLLILNYDKSGQTAGEILITDGGMVKRYSDLKNKLLQKAVPLAAFVKKLEK